MQKRCKLRTCACNQAVTQKHSLENSRGPVGSREPRSFGLALVHNVNARESSKQAAGKVQSQKSAAVKIMVKHHKKRMSEHVFAIMCQKHLPGV